MNKLTDLKIIDVTDFDEDNLIIDQVDAIFKVIGMSDVFEGELLYSENKIKMLELVNSYIDKGYVPFYFCMSHDLPESKEYSLCQAMIKPMSVSYE